MIKWSVGLGKWHESQVNWLFVLCDKGFERDSEVSMFM